MKINIADKSESYDIKVTIDADDYYESERQDRFEAARDNINRLSPDY